jgi:RHS repeat-associated protein
MQPQNLIENSSIPYSFNGMEKDNEVKGEGNSYDFGARMLDSRIGRWLSNDALEAKYPNINPYNSNDNNPLFFADKDGNDAIGTIEGNTITIKSTLYVYNEGKHKIDIKKMQKNINKCYSGNHTTKVEGKSYNVKFEITVKEISKENLTKPMEAGGNYVQPMPSDYRSNVQGAGGHYGKFAEGQYEDPTYPHEVGHMIGLDDQYIDIVKIDDNTLASDKGELKSVDIPGTSKNELMGTAAGDWKNNPQLTEKDINALAKYVLDNQKDGVTLINSKNLASNKLSNGLASPSAGAKFDFLIEMDKKGYEVVEPHSKK